MVISKVNSTDWEMSEHHRWTQANHPAVSDIFLVFGGCSGGSVEKEMAPHSSTLAWKIPWMVEPGGLQSMGSQRIGHDRATSLHFTSGSSEGRICLQCRRTGFDPWVEKIPWRREWQPTPVFWRIPWTDKPGRLQSLGCKESDVSERLTLITYLLYLGRVPFCKGTETNLQSFSNRVFLKLHCPSDSGSLGLGSGPGIRIL